MLNTNKLNLKGTNVSFAGSGKAKECKYGIKTLTTVSAKKVTMPDGSGYLRDKVGNSVRLADGTLTQSGDVVFFKNGFDSPSVFKKMPVSFPKDTKGFMKYIRGMLSR